MPGISARFTGWVVAGGLVVTVVLTGGAWLLDRHFPIRLADRPGSTVVTAADGTPLRAFADRSGIWRYPVTPDQVSPLYLTALLTYEDRWFFRHPGINPLAVLRAGFQNLSAGRIVSGGSTLTMQVARLLFPEAAGSTWRAKMIQALRALQLERHCSKSRILSLYLTYAPFGANLQGVWAGSHTWLGKAPVSLTHAEAALLAVLPQAPSAFRPDRHSQRARRARDKVLDRLAARGVWTKDQVAAARREPVVAFRYQPPMTAPLAARRLKRAFPGEPVITTLLDPDLQVHIEALLSSYISRLPARQSGAVLVVSLSDLAVRAYAGSADFLDERRAGHVDMVTALRSPGSTLKPFAYGMAMDDGLIHSHSLLLDIPRYTRAYQPENFTGGFLGPVSAAQALTLSLNVPAVQVLEAVGPQLFHDRLINAGARLALAGPPNLSMILGGVGTDLFSLVTLYTALARGGLAGRPRLVRRDPLTERYLMSPGAAYIIRQILSRPLPGQDGVSRLSGGRSLAWKTGTSYGFRDAWALGVTAGYVAGVWIGRPDGTPSPGQYGAITAIPLLSRVLESLPDDTGQPPASPVPASVSRQTICWPLGVAPEQTPGPCQVRHVAWILNHWIPPTLSDPLYGPLTTTFWVDDHGRRAGPGCGGIRRQTVALWPRPLSPWLPADWLARHRTPDPSPDCPGLAPVAGSPVKIISIADGSVLTRLPGGQGAPPLPLTAAGGRGALTWFLNRQPVTTPASAGLPMPDPGRYDLSVMDSTGQYDRISFSVIRLSP